MLNVEFGPRLYLVATAWNELSPRQLLRITRLHGQPFASDRALEDAFRRVLLQVPGRVLAKLNGVQRSELRHLVPVAFLRNPSEASPLTEQLLPHLTRPLWRDPLQRRYYGPRANFRNLRFAEFMFADAFFLRYLKTNDETQLDRLVAVLYRPQRRYYAPNSPSYGGDRREDFNENLLDARAKRLAAVPHHVKYAVMLWYRGCRKALESRFEYVFTADNNNTASTGGWSDVLHQLAGSVHHIDATAEQFLPTVLREMNRTLKQAEEAREAINK
jgi:hypothetical protein